MTTKLKPKMISKTHEDDKELCQQLCTFRNENEFLDFTIRVQGDEIRAHRLILASRSPVLKAMLCGDMIEARAGEISLDHFKPHIVRAVLDYMYSGSILLEYEHVEDRLEIVDYLQMGILCRKLEEQLLLYLKIDTCLHLSLLADKFKLTKLKITSEIMMADKFDLFAQQDQFKGLTYLELLNLIKRNDLQQLKADILLESCLEWIYYDEHNRITKLPVLLENIDILRYSPPHLAYLLKKFNGFFFNVNSVSRT